MKNPTKSTIQKAWHKANLAKILAQGQRAVRDFQIYRDHMEGAGEGVRALARKHNISPARVCRILQRIRKEIGLPKRKTTTPRAARRAAAHRTGV